MGQGLWFISARVKDTKTPSSRERPPRSHLTNVERGNPAVIRQSGKPTARKAQHLSGHRTSREANASGRKAQGNPQQCCRITCWIRHRPTRHES
jgi:hypothetical protein